MSKPTASGEWTGITLSRLIKEKGYKGAADAHNAALAAEREVGGNTAIALAQQITKLEDQLAAQEKPVQLPMINDDPVIQLK